MATAMATDWPALEELVQRLVAPGEGPQAVPAAAWEPLQHAFADLNARQDGEGLIRLRLLLAPLYSRDSVTGLPLLQRIDDGAIAAAETLGRDGDLGHFWGARGHNLHRQGFHRQAVGAFEQSVCCYRQAGEEWPALKSYYMLSLCRRALGDRAGALRVLDEVLAQVPPDDPWRGNPLQVKAWLQRDRGDMAGAEASLRQSLALQERTNDPDILVAGSLVDLGEVISLQGRDAEAVDCFERSLALLARHRGQYNRQEARTLLRYAEHLLRRRVGDAAMPLLQRADDLIRSHGQYYDQMWRLELAYSRVYWQWGEWRVALRKLRSALRYRNLLRLPVRNRLRMLARRLGWGLRARETKSRRGERPADA